MNKKYKGLMSAIDAGRVKASKIYLLCNNPVSQQSLDDNEFPPNNWLNPRIVAADSTILAFYCPTNKSWVITKAKASWINQSAKPENGLIEIKPELDTLLAFGGND